MKNEEKINCPHCGKEVALKQAISHKMKQELWLKAQQAAESKFKDKYSLELKDMQNQISEQKNKLEHAEKKELEFLKRERLMEEKEKSLELELQKKLTQEKKLLTLELEKKFQTEEKEHLSKMREEIQEANKRKLLEKEQQIEQMRKTVEELKRKSEQGSMQIQGDSQEENLKSTLKQAFPYDEIEDVPTGIKGADLIHHVKNNRGEQCGIILWESKNTKQWSNNWISKLKEDQVRAKADICIIVSQALPQDIKSFSRVEGVWVCGPKFFMPLSETLRFNLQEVHRSQKSQEGKKEKLEILYKYLSGHEFKNRVENIVFAFQNLKGELEKEKRSMQRIWSKREKELEKVVMNTSGMYGDLQGILGRSLSTVQALELEEPSDDDDN